MSKTLVAAYDSFEPILDIIEKVTDIGVPKESISLVAKNPDGRHDHLLNVNVDTDVEAPEGALFGTITGALVGLGVNTLTIPSLGAMLFIGPLGIAIGAGVGAVVGGISASLIDLGVSEDEATSYSEGFKSEQDTLLVLHAVPDELIPQVQAILNSYLTVRIIQRKPE